MSGVRISPGALNLKPIFSTRIGFFMAKNQRFPCFAYRHIFGHIGHKLVYFGISCHLFGHILVTFFRLSYYVLYGHIDRNGACLVECMHYYQILRMRNVESFY